MKDKLKNVPFGDSIFQIVNFISNEYTPERSYRKILLQLDKKNKAMMECKFRRKRREIDILEIEKKLQNANEFEKMRLEIDKEEAEYYLESEIKLIEDCIIEIKTYEKLLEQFPDFSRNDFEKSEYGYWKKRLIKDAECQINSMGTVSEGTIKALGQIGIKGIQKNDQGNLIIFEDKEFKINDYTTISDDSNMSSK